MFEIDPFFIFTTSALFCILIVFYYVYDNPSLPPLFGLTDILQFLVRTIWKDGGGIGKFTAVSFFAVPTALNGPTVSEVNSWFDHPLIDPESISFWWLLAIPMVGCIFVFARKAYSLESKVGKLEDSFSPRISIDFETTDEFVMNKINYPLPGHDHDPSVHYRIKAYNASLSRMMDCLVKITKIEYRSVTNSEYVDCQLPQNISLRWSDKHQRSMVLSTEDEQYFGLISATQVWGCPKVSSLDNPVAGGFDNVLSTEGEYRITFRVFAHIGPPTEASVVMLWNGSWNQITAQLQNNHAGGPQTNSADAMP